MTVLSQLQDRGFKLDGRIFAVFLIVQGGLVAAALLGFVTPLLLLAAGVAGVAYLVVLPLRPWAVIAAIVVTTNLDITGRLIKTTSIGIPLTTFHLSFVLMVAAIGANILLYRRRVFPAFELKAPLVMFLAVMAVSQVYSPNQPEATVGFVRTALLVLFVYLTQVMIDSKQAVHMVVISMAAAIVLGAALGAWQLATDEFHLPVRVAHTLGANVPRATGTFHNPNIFGAFLMGGVVLLVGVLLNVKLRWWKQAFLGLAVLIGFLGILASFSRSNWLATGAGVLCVLWLAKKLRYFVALAVAVPLVLLVLSYSVDFAAYLFDRFLSIFTLVEQFGSESRTSGTARVYLVMAAFEMFLDNPLLGVGWRGFPIVFSEYAPPGYPWWSLVDESHTALATILAELGLLGLIAVLWFIGRSLRAGIRGVAELQDPYLRAVLIGLVGAFVGFQVNQAFNADFSNNIFWFYTGVIFAVLRLDREAQAN